MSKHCVYSISTGNYTANGVEVIKFGLAYEANLPCRLDAHLTLSQKVPEVLGVLFFATRDLARQAEQRILNRFQHFAPPQRPDSELRLATVEVREFIKYEMERYVMDTQRQRRANVSTNPASIKDAAATLTAASSVEEIMIAFRCDRRYAETIRKERFQ